jgi:seryl-tRNA synthetase
MTDLLDLERRDAALEAAQRETAKTQTWMASTLGRIASVQDQHTVAIAELTSDVGELKSDVGELKAGMREVKADLKSLRADLPAMLADAVREGMKGH